MLGFCLDSARILLGFRLDSAAILFGFCLDSAPLKRDPLPTQGVGLCLDFLDSARILLGFCYSAWILHRLSVTRCRPRGFDCAWILPIRSYVAALLGHLLVRWVLLGCIEHTKKPYKTNRKSTFVDMDCTLSFNK